MADLLLSTDEEIEIWDGPFEVWVPSPGSGRLVLTGALTTDVEEVATQGIAIA